MNSLLDSFGLLKIFPRKRYDSAIGSSEAFGDLVVDFARLGCFNHEDFHWLDEISVRKECPQVCTMQCFHLIGLKQRHGIDVRV